MSNVNNPAHYNKYPHEVIELTEQFDNNMGNVFKYIIRAPFKSKYHEDMQKAAWYLKRIVEKKQKLRVITKSIEQLGQTFQNALVNEIIQAAKKKDYDQLYSIADFIQKTRVLTGTM